MANYDLNTSQDRFKIRGLATSARYAGHPLAAWLLAALDVITHLQATELVRQAAEELLDEHSPEFRAANDTVHTMLQQLYRGPQR